MALPILIVEDNADIAGNIRAYLQMNGREAEIASDGLQALERLSNKIYGLCVLDIGLPLMDGITVCKRLRAQGSALPIIMLTARDSIDDRVIGLEAGADDYLIKPFALRELLARIEALMRRTYGNQEQTLKVADLTFDLQQTQVLRAGVPIKLNPTCLTILKELMLQSPSIVSRNRLDHLLWSGEAPTSDSLRANIYLLRQAIDKPFEKKLIHTHPGLGWSIRS